MTLILEKPVFSEQHTPAPSHQAESAQPVQQENKRAGPQPSPGQPLIVEIEQTSKWNDPIVIATLVVGAIYLAILFVYIFQLMEMRKTTSLARDSADAAKKSADTLAGSERAWLGPQRAEISGPLPIPAGPPIYFEVFVVNSGRTPALKVQTNIMAQSFPVGTEFVPEYPPSPDTLPHYGGSAVIQPGMQFFLRTQPTSDITQEIINTLRDGRKVFYIYGKIDYEDVFGKPHRTTFCFFLHPTLDRLSACKTYNSAD